MQEILVVGAGHLVTGNQIDQLFQKFIQLFWRAIFNDVLIRVFYFSKTLLVHCNARYLCPNFIL